MRTADSTTKAILLSHFPERIQAALKAYASEVDLSPETVVQLAIAYFLESADIELEPADIKTNTNSQDSLGAPSNQGVLACLPFLLQRGIEQYATEAEFPPEFVVELAVTFLLDPDASNFEDCQAGVQKEQVYLLQQYREARQVKAA
ncbi:hypothetical protein H6F93_32050 [Leptolyngbya sp. FACHB-671]|uniref:hypothetical protein n=1 Tax=Leptolyngbya sp. FACHB-671 TaxID=2692812 RepID=UPI00168973FC|nr:hypothetical protein [Leptolyngbya sp. FACHB-671]MBD2072103.1 hypothetical protein [Leptolyngbya sp. FACHB-671]